MAQSLIGYVQRVGRVKILFFLRVWFCSFPFGQRKVLSSLIGLICGFFPRFVLSGKVEVFLSSLLCVMLKSSGVVEDLERTFPFRRVFW